MMRIIPTSIHGLLDYGLGVILLALPFLSGTWGAGGIEAGLPLVLGAGVICLSLFTNYELALSRVIPMQAHLAADAVAGVVLVAAPFLFGFANRTWIPFVVLGVLEVGASLMTQTQPKWLRATVRP